MGTYSNCYRSMQVKVKCAIIIWLLKFCKWTLTWTGRNWKFIRNIEWTECKIINTKYRSYRGVIEGTDYNVWNDIWFAKLGAMLYLSFILSYSDLVLSTFCRWLLPCITHTNTHSRSLELPWTSDQAVAETSTWQHITHNRQKSPPRRDSNPQSQQASRRRHTL